MSFKDYSKQLYQWLTGARTPEVNLANAAAALLKGIATGGTETTIVDTSKDFDTAAFATKIAKVTIGNIEYYRAISACAGDTITITTIQDAAGAIAVVGSGLDAEGQVTISVAEGTGGDYTVQFVSGTGVSSASSVTFDVASGLLTVTSPTDVDENPVGIMPGDLQGVINTDANANGIFTVTAVVGGVALPTETNILTFTDDEITVGTGLPAEGRVSIHCKGDLIGTVGDDYSVQIVQGTATTADDIAMLNTTTKTLTITVNLDGTGSPRLLAAGSLQTLLANAVGIADKFVIPDGFTAGNLPIGGDAIPFVGGINEIAVPVGAPYEILMG